jgi:glutamine synthetase
MAIYKNNALLKASIMTAQNAHRLGANEAPPAIISVFLGSQVSAVLDKLEKSSSEEAIVIDEKQKMKLSIAKIPEVLLDNTDRNRTSPFAFTGNRFEFRATGSSANCSSAMIVLNAIVAAQLAEFKKTLDAQISSGISKEKAIFDLLKKYINESKSICFDGNGYSDEWKTEAQKRGLDCETSTPLVIDAYTKPQSIELFESIGVFNERELSARNEVKWETYTKKIQIETRVLGNLVLNHIIPVAKKYQSLLLDNVYKIHQIYEKEKAEKLSAQDMKIIELISEYTSIIKTKTEEMTEARKIANTIENVRSKAIEYHDKIEPFLDEIRHQADQLELIVDDELWTLPKYRELLFLR